MKLPKDKVRGMHVFCTKHQCSKVISNPKTKCTHKNVLASNCPFSEKHVFQSRIWNPITKKTDRIKSYPKIEHASEFLSHHIKFKQELKANDYHVIKEEKPVSRSILLHELINQYLDYLNDINVPEHEKKHLDTDYKDGEKRYLKTFLKAISTVYKPSEILISAVNSKMIGMLYTYLNEYRKENGDPYSARTWNAHFIAGAKFINWLNRPEQGYSFINHFNNVQRRPEAKDPQIVEESEFELFLSLIKKEDGVEIVGRKRKEKKQRYKPWLKYWFFLSVLTGGRREDVALMKCKHAKANYFEIPNHKVNNKENTDINKSYPPMTEELYKLLLKLNVFDRDPEEYVIEPKRENRKILAGEASAGFKHFWKLTGIEKKVTLYSLRDTYITRMIIEKGDKGAGIHHKKLDTAYKHYFGKQEANKDLVGKRVFGLKVEQLLVE